MKNDVFATTRWTQVLAASNDSDEGRQALSDLCAVYYGPVVAFVRNYGHTEDDARDLAHEFFARVLARQSLSGADPSRGRFRSYLLGALKHFLANQRARQLTERRGGFAVHLPLESQDATSGDIAVTELSNEPPDRAFDRDWALNVLERAIHQLKREFEASGRGKEFELLKLWLTGENVAGAKQAADELGVTEGTFRVAVHRLRRRFREIVKSEVATTVDDPADVAAEMQVLIEALA